MSIVKRLTIVCEVCPASDYSAFRAYAETAAEARRQARLEGWRRDKLGRDVCPKHPKLKGARR